MTFNELKRRYPNASNDFIRRNLDALSAESRPRPVIQELKGDRAGKKRPAVDADHQAGTPEVDEGRGGEFYIAVTLRISDERNRDNDGAYTTLQDCLIAAVGRLAQMDPITLRSHAARLKKK